MFVNRNENFLVGLQVFYSPVLFGVLLSVLTFYIFLEEEGFWDLQWVLRSL